MMAKEYSQAALAEFKERFKKIIDKKIKTTMICPLSEFESYFGELWGSHKNYEDLTDDERKYRQKWQKCREKILDTGNRQIKNINSELDFHDIVWKRYTAELIIRKDQ